MKGILIAMLIPIACIPPRVSGAKCVASTILDRPTESRAAWRATSTAQRIEGRVLEADAESPIGNASVMLSPTGRAVRTDAKGMFRFDDVPTGTYRVLTDATGYDSRSDSVDVIAGHGVKGDVQLALQRSRTVACQTSIPTPR